MERFSGTPLPPCVKTILKFAAYDSASSLVQLNSQLIVDIENFINDTDKSVIEQLSCCNAERYKEQVVFRFLPGHKCAILALPSVINRMSGSKKKSTVAEFKKLLTQAELEDMLLTKLHNNVEHIKSNGANLLGTFEQSHLSDTKTIISDNSMIAKCTVKCFLCMKSISATFNGSWTTHNIIRHVKMHGTANLRKTDEINGVLPQKRSKSGKKNSFTNIHHNELIRISFDLYSFLLGKPTDDFFSVIEEISVEADVEDDLEQYARYEYM